MSGYQEQQEQGVESDSTTTVSFVDLNIDGHAVHCDAPTKEEMDQAVRRREAAETRCRRAEEEAERQRKHAQRCEEDRRRAVQELDNWRRQEHLDERGKSAAEAQKWKAEANRLHLDSEQAKDELSALKIAGTAKSAECEALNAELESCRKELRAAREQIQQLEEERAVALGDSEGKAKLPALNAALTAEVGQLKTEKQQLKSRLAALEKEQEADSVLRDQELGAQAARKNAELTELRAALAAREAEKQKLAETVTEQSSSLQSLHGEMASLRAQRTEAASKLEIRASEGSLLKSELQQLQTEREIEISELKARFELEQREKHSESELEARKLRAEADRKAREVAALSSELERLTEDLEQRRVEGSENEALLSSKQRENSRLKSELDRLRSEEHQQRRQQLSSAAEDARQLAADAELKELEYAELRAEGRRELNELRSRAEHKDRESTELHGTLAELRAELRELEASREAAAIKNVELAAEVAQLKAEAVVDAKRLALEAEAEGSGLRMDADRKAAEVAALRERLEVVEAEADGSERLLRAHYQYYGTQSSAAPAIQDVDKLRDELLAVRKERLAAEAALGRASDGHVETDPREEQQRLLAEEQAKRQAAQAAAEAEAAAAQAAFEAELAKIVSGPEGELVTFNLALVCSLEDWMHNVQGRAAALQSFATMLELPESAVGITGACGSGPNCMTLSVAVSLQGVSLQQLAGRVSQLQGAALTGKLFFGAWPVQGLVPIPQTSTPRRSPPTVPPLQLRPPQHGGQQQQQQRSPASSLSPGHRQSSPNEIECIERELAELQGSRGMPSQGPPQLPYQSPPQLPSQGPPQLPSPIKRLQSLQEQLMAGQTASIRNIRESLTKAHTQPPARQEEVSQLDERHLQVLNSPREPLPHQNVIIGMQPKQVRFAPTNHMRLF